MNRMAAPGGQVATYVTIKESGRDQILGVRLRIAGGKISEGEMLVVRPKELYDNAVPGGNSAAAEALLRLALLAATLAISKAAAGEPTSVQVAFFESKVRPVLVERIEDRDGQPLYESTPAKWR